MKELFEKISIEENTELQVNYGPSYSKLITFHPFLDDKHTAKKVTSLLLNINYRNQTINVLNKMGTMHVGEVNCILLEGLELPSFAVSTRNRLIRLVNKKISLLKVESEEKEFAEFIRQQLLNVELEDIARRSQFEPEIKGILKSEYEISTEYSTSFALKNEVIRPLISFYKLLIDYCLDHSMIKNMLANRESTAK